MHSSTNPIAQSALANFDQFQWSQGVQDRVGGKDRASGAAEAPRHGNLGDLPNFPEGLRPAPIVGRKHKSLHPSSSSESSLSPRDSPRGSGRASPRHYPQYGSGDEYDSQIGSQHGSSCDEGDESGSKRRKPSKSQWTDEEDLFMDAVRMAIRVGGDVDTTAAMTAALAGARVGLSGLPQMAEVVTDQGTYGYDELCALASQAWHLAMRG